jgi:hypothetical protein
MIGMFCEDDQSAVGYEEFRKLASGEIVGLTTTPTGDKNKRRTHSRILSNLQNTRLKHTLLPVSSEALLAKLKKDRAS